MLRLLLFSVEESPDFLSPFVLRAIQDFDADQKSCTVPVDISEGTEIRFMRRDHEAILESGRTAYERLMAELNTIQAAPQLICQFDCAGRGRAIVGNDVSKGMEMAQQQFDPSIPLMGMFAFGEISPMNHDNHFHNFTATLAAFY